MSTVWVDLCHFDQFLYSILTQRFIDYFTVILNHLLIYQNVWLSENLGIDVKFWFYLVHVSLIMPRMQLKKFIQFLLHCLCHRFFNEWQVFIAVVSGNGFGVADSWLFDTWYYPSLHIRGWKNSSYRWIEWSTLSFCFSRIIFLKQRFFRTLLRLIKSLLKIIVFYTKRVVPNLLWDSPLNVESGQAQCFFHVFSLVVDVTLVDDTMPWHIQLIKHFPCIWRFIQQF